ncbi:hypothetical protein WHK13_14260, partial [Staphylococcus aureus]|uniref:hypothetical protein n=1 Tax=Staphylococcus aureus TaxID=1280 RepID=UPI0039BDD4F1
SVTGDVVATATTGNLDITGSLLSAGDATLTAGEDSTLANLATGGALNWQVGGDAELVQGTVGGTTTIATGGNLALDALQATGDVGTQSGADTTIAQLTVSQGNLDSTA